MSELPPNWVISPLEDIVDILDSFRIPLNVTERERSITGKRKEELYPYYGATGIAGYINDYLFDEPLVLLGEDGVPFFDPLRPKAYLVSGKYWVNNHAHVLRAEPNLIDQRYICAFLNFFDYKGYVTGSTRSKLTQTAMRTIPVPIAPLGEQKRIADKLDALLVRIDACQTRLARVRLILNRFRQTVLAAATSGKLTEDWREEMGLSLDSWQTKSGADIFNYITSGSRGWAKYYADSGAIFLRIGNLAHETIKLNLDEVQYVNPPDVVEGKRTRIEIGDILISITADIGRVAFISEDIGEAYINQHLCLARQNGDHLGSYLAYYLVSPLGGLAQLTGIQRGATKAGIALGDIKALEIQIPEKKEQYEIVRRVEALFTLADRIEARCQTAQTLVESLNPTLLSKAFSGELVPQNPNDEPASALMKRIRAERAAKPDKSKRASSGRKPKGMKMNEESVKEAIRQLPNDMFSFDELRNNLASDYEKLKDLVFKLLSETEPSIIQIFDEASQAIRFVRSKK